MKSIGLCTILAQCGFPVPASKFRIAPFRAIFTRILGNDNLWAGLSSFAVEMTEFREILRLADSHSLVLGDELCSGTESLSATALVAAGIETLVGRRAKFLFATHLHELAGLIGTGTGVQISHLAVHYDDTTDTLIYDRVMKPGSGSALYGLEVCRALDMPADFIERAAAIRKRLTSIPHTSVYSSESVVDCCGVCGSTEALETHHIRQQAGFSGPEVDLNAPHNLVCLCDTCHDDHHAGRLDISGWEDTAAGRRLVWSRPQKEESVLSPDIIAFIKDEKALKRRVATIQRVVEQRFGIKITETAIRGVR
jgi:DNA mismatch repair protein MutS